MKYGLTLLLFMTLTHETIHATTETTVRGTTVEWPEDTIEHDPIGVRFGNNLRVRRCGAQRGTFKGRQEARITHIPNNRGESVTNFRTNSTGTIGSRIPIKKEDTLRFRSVALKRFVDITFRQPDHAISESSFFLDSIEVFMSRTEERKFLTGTIQGFSDSIDPRKVRIYYRDNTDDSNDSSSTYVNADIMGRFAIPVHDGNYNGEICITMDTTVVNGSDADRSNEEDDGNEDEESVGLICCRIILPESTSVHIDVYFDDGLEKELKKLRLGGSQFR